MQWKKPKYKINDTRIIIRFLLFPRTINGICKWLEKVKILQTFSRVTAGYIDIGLMEYSDEWIDTDWID